MVARGDPGDLRRERVEERRVAVPPRPGHADLDGRALHEPQELGAHRPVRGAGAHEPQRVLRSRAAVPLADVTHEMAIMREETFGPCLPIQVVRDEEEALALANDSSFGLQARAMR